MIRLPQRSTLTDTCFPTRSSSDLPVGAVTMVLDEDVAAQHAGKRFELQVTLRRIAGLCAGFPLIPPADIVGGVDQCLAIAGDIAHSSRGRSPFFAIERSEERRVGKECFRTCRSRGSPHH